MILEVADKIVHPSLPGFWIASATVGAVAHSLSTTGGRMWAGLSIATLWLLGTLLWVMSFFFGHAGLPGEHFPREVSNAYFVHLLVASTLPALVIVGSPILVRLKREEVAQ